MEIAFRRAADKPRATLPHASLAARLDDLGRRVGRLGHDARKGAEGFVCEKLSLAAEIRQVARELGR